MLDPNNLPHHVYLHKDHKYRLKLGFYAAPSNPKAFSKAIRDELQNLKFTYCSDLNGLIMGFGKISSNELIPADIRHCINVVVNVDVYIFRPPVGSIIEAVVNQTSDNHVSCLVHNLFNVSIVRPENEPCDQWSGSKIKKDDKIDVKVLSFDLTKKLPHITGEIIKKKDECYDPKDIQNTSTKSLSSKKNVSDFTKSFNKNTASLSTFSSSDSESSHGMDNVITKSKICSDKLTKSPLLINTTIKHVQKEGTTVSSSKCSSSDSESSDEMNSMITKSKIYADVSTKTSPLSINTTIKHAQIEDIAVSSSKVSSSDSESSAEINNMITSSKICEDKSTMKQPVSTSTTIKHQDTTDCSKLYNADNSSKCSSSDSEFSDSKIKVKITNFEECIKKKSTRTSSLICNNINHIESPLYSSTPILNSEHSVNSINLIRNKQLEQLQKHLAKNSSIKQKSLASVKVPNQFSKNKLSQSLNILKNIKNNDNNDSPLEVFAASVSNKDNLESSNKINQHGNLQGDSDVSDSELKHTNTSVNNSFSKESEKATKRTKKYRKSNEIVNAILNSINLNKMKFNANITKNLVDSNNEYNNDEKEENTLYAQHNLDEGLLINPKNLNKPVIKNSLTLNLSTKKKKREDSPQKKNMDDSEKQVKKNSNIISLMISDSDSNCSKDFKSHVPDLSRTTDFNKKIDSDTSSSDDEIYSKLRQNISKTQINTHDYNEKPKSQSVLYNQIYFSTDESDTSSKLFHNTSKLSSKLIKSNITIHDSINISETDGCNKSHNNNSKKKTLKKDSKKKGVDKKSEFSELSNKSANKMDIIQHILDEDSSSDGEVTALKNKSSDGKKINEKVSRQKSTLNISKLNKNDELLNKNISNPFLKIYTENITSSSSDDETFVKNLLKSKKKSSEKRKINPLVNEEEKKNILINQVLTSIKRKDKKQKQMLPVSQNNSKASNSKKILFKNDKRSKDKPTVKTKNKKDIQNNLKISIGEPNRSNLNISQKVNSSQLIIQPSSDESTDEEKDFIKKFLKKQKLKKTKKANVPEESMKINIPTKSVKQNEIKEKLHTKSKSKNVSTTDEVKSNDTKKKKKRQRETKDCLLNSIISALENSSSDHAKKKKKDHTLTNEELHGSKGKNSDGYLSEVTIKKKKKSKHKDDANVSDLIVKDNKKKYKDSFFESSLKNIQAKVDNPLGKVSRKKKVKSDPVFYETQSTNTDNSSKIIDKLEDNDVKLFNNTRSSKKNTDKSSKIIDNLEDNNVKNLKNARSSKKNTKKLLESQMKNFMLTQDNTHLDKLYDLLNAHLIQS